MTKYRVEVDEYKNIRWYKWETNEFHREDGPAVEYADGNKYWWLNDKLHREDGPAIECANGNKSWHLNGEYLSESEWNKRVNADNHEGKTVEVDGTEYELKRK